jgi:hypothetical protein
MLKRCSGFLEYVMRRPSMTCIAKAEAYVSAACQLRH